MLALPQSANLLLPDDIPVTIESVILCSLIPILAAALYGSRIAAAPFRWRRIAGATFGVLMGVVLIPLALGVSVLVVNLCGPQLHLKPGGFEVHAIICLVIYLMTSTVAFFASMIGRPARVAPSVMMETFNQNLLEIEEIVSGKLRRLGGDVGASVDVGTAQAAGILSQDQAGRLEYIFRMQHQLQHASSVAHSDVELWARKSCDLLDEIRRQLATNREPTIASKECDQPLLENSNPYAPPAS